MSDWQPVVIVNDGDKMHKRAGRRAYKMASVHGKRVRVRPIDAAFPDYCDGRFYEVHPDDYEIIGCSWGDALFCEHQILTD